MKSTATFGEATHTCPVCGEKGPCIHATWTVGQVRFHNCNICGSTWRDSEIQKSIEENLPIEKTAALVSLL